MRSREIKMPVQCCCKATLAPPTPMPPTPPGTQSLPPATTKVALMCFSMARASGKAPPCFGPPQIRASSPPAPVGSTAPMPSGIWKTPPALISTTTAKLAIPTHRSTAHSLPTRAATTASTTQTPAVTSPLKTAEAAPIHLPPPPTGMQPLHAPPVPVGFKSFSMVLPPEPNRPSSGLPMPTAPSAPAVAGSPQAQSNGNGKPSQALISMTMRNSVHQPPPSVACSTTAPMAPINSRTQRIQTALFS